MKTFIIGLVVGLILLPLFGYCYVLFGYAPVATSAPPFPMERRLASMALKARISKEAPKDSPIPASESNLMEGARLYRDNCAVCHGMSAGAKTPIAKGMYPTPPQLLKGKGVSDDPSGETWWKLKNGIRLTGMPAFGDSLADTQLWQVSLLLANSNKLPAAVSAYLADSSPVK